MTEPTRGVRQRRSNRRPGWPLSTALLVLAIVASSVLVFTNKVELLKLAVIVALWAAIIAAFISFIYRRQADIDQARARDLKLVYDLQLDREILARREYELSVESQLRRELTSELRAQASDEVASLRAELAALRANLEVLFDTDLQQRPALETERTAVHTFGRVISSRIDTEDSEDLEPITDESPIIDVPEEPHPPEREWVPTPVPGGVHRRPSEREPAETTWAPTVSPTPRQSAVPEPEVQSPWPPPEQPPVPAPSAPIPMPAWQSTERDGRRPPDVPDWQPVPAEGQFIPAGEPGSNWTSPQVENLTTPAPAPAEPDLTSPATAPPTSESRRARHATSDSNGEAQLRQARHSTGMTDDPARPAPALATPPQPSGPPPSPAEMQGARHTGGDEPVERSDSETGTGQHAGGQPVSELLARLQVSSTGGSRRRRRED